MKKFSFYKIMSILFFVTGLIFGIIAFVSGTETGAVEGAIAEDGYVQTMTEQVDYKLFLSAICVPWILCAFFGYCDSKSDAGSALKEVKELVAQIKK